MEYEEWSVAFVVVYDSNLICDWGMIMYPFSKISSFYEDDLYDKCLVCTVFLLCKDNIVPQSANARNGNIHLRARDKILGRVQASADTCGQSKLAQSLRNISYMIQRPGISPLETTKPILRISGMKDMFSPPGVPVIITLPFCNVVPCDK